MLKTANKVIIIVCHIKLISGTWIIYTYKNVKVFNGFSSALLILWILLNEKSLKVKEITIKLHPR